jgi:hypothetical protein
MIGLRPHVLGGIEFRRVRRKVVHPDPKMRHQERSDLAPAMDWAAIPEHVDRSAQMAKEMTEESLDIEAREIVTPAPQIQGQPPMLG